MRLPPLGNLSIGGPRGTGICVRPAGGPREDVPRAFRTARHGVLLWAVNLGAGDPMGEVG